MSFLQAVIISIVEGITEFLPISSTGHMILTADLLKVPSGGFTSTFEISIQLGAILAVVFLYWKKLLAGFEIWKKIILAFLPSAVLGFISCSSALSSQPYRCILPAMAPSNPAFRSGRSSRWRRHTSAITWWDGWYRSRRERSLGCWLAGSV